MSKPSWKPWHKVVTLREDLRSGELSMNLFAADLYEVMMQRGKRPVYEKPELFFAFTFPTYNLRHLVRDVALRLAGKNNKAVRQLELTYGGGKTHTLITLRHLVYDPENLPKLPSVDEFIEEIGQPPPKCRVAALCFDKLDVEKGMDIRSPEGKIRTLKYPWSVLAYQLAGDEGLKLLHAKGKAEERDSAPAENLLTELLEMSEKEGLGTLILIDEVLMYAREKVAQEKEWRSKLVNFFQYLTQASSKVDRCCLVASLLATDPRKSDTLGREIQAELYEIFHRQREEAVEPVVKEDVAEVLRRRFFTLDSLKNRDSFRQHVVAALKGIIDLDEQTKKQGSEVEERFLKSFPFHPELTEVLYSKWTQLTQFQRTRGVLRTFALALREAEKWDTSPLVGPAVFLSAPEKEGLAESLREMVTVADTEEWEGKKQAWTGILDNEFSQAKQIQKESIGLKNREIEQAVVTTFLHSQPIGQNARTRDLMMLIGPVRPDKIELEKGLSRWSKSSYWLDDLYTVTLENQLPNIWRLGNRPNLTQMHAVAARNIPDEVVRARLLDDISKVKALTANASASGIHVHLLPTRPKDIEDDGSFHYAVLGPNTASDSGKPSTEAKRFLEETTGADRPRVYRNSVLLLVPFKDGLEFAMARVRDYLAWDSVREDLKKQKEGNLDESRTQTLQIHLDKSKSQIPEAIKQAYCIVVTISEKNEPQAFKITVSEEPHFNIIKGDNRSRIQDTAVTAEALLPEGPYNLWRSGETFRRIKDLESAFAQLPHLPKMLKADAIFDTLINGCEKGIFVLRLNRPDGTFHTWWMSRPEENVLKNSAMELVLPHVAELSEIPPLLLVKGKLPNLWSSDEITVKSITDYFNGDKVVQIPYGGYQEPMQIPKASKLVVEKAIHSAVENALLWFISNPSISIFGESLPMGVLTEDSTLSVPPSVIAVTEILPENLPKAWKAGIASVKSIAEALSEKSNKVLPWKVIQEVITSALQNRIFELEIGSEKWPCDFLSAHSIKIKVLTDSSFTHSKSVTRDTLSKIFLASTKLEPSQIQDFGEKIPDFLKIKNKFNIPIQFNINIEVGDGKNIPQTEAIQKINDLLNKIKEGFYLK